MTASPARPALPNGYTDIGPGKIGAIATSLEMLARPEPRTIEPRTIPAKTAFAVRPIARPEPAWYRDLFARVGTPWLWHSRLRLSTTALEALIRDPHVEVWALSEDGRDEGLLELDFRERGDCELSFFGLTERLVGRGAGRLLMTQAIERAWARPIRRFWVHTCTLDHPGALAFYIRSGFQPFQRQIEIADDPRLDGTLPRNAAPHVPIIERPSQIS